MEIMNLLSFCFIILVLTNDAYGRPSFLLVEIAEPATAKGRQITWAGDQLNDPWPNVFSLLRPGQNEGRRRKSSGTPIISSNPVYDWKQQQKNRRRNGEMANNSKNNRPANGASPVNSGGSFGNGSDDIGCENFFC